MRLLIDMNLTPRWVRCLARAGHESVHWSELGPASAPDTAICEYARERAFVLVTNDMDFPQILAHTAEAKPSVILLRGEPLVAELLVPDGATEASSAGHPEEHDTLDDDPAPDADDAIAAGPTL